MCSNKINFKELISLENLKKGLERKTMIDSEPPRGIS